MFSQNTINEANRHIHTLTVENEELKQAVKHKNAVMKLMQEDLNKKMQELQRAQQENSNLQSRLGALGLVDIEAEMESFLGRIKAAKGVAQMPLPHLAQCRPGGGQTGRGAENGHGSSENGNGNGNMSLRHSMVTEIDTCDNASLNSADGFTNSEYGGSEANTLGGYRHEGSIASRGPGSLYGDGGIPEINSEDEYDDDRPRSSSGRPLSGRRVQLPGEN